MRKMTTAFAFVAMAVGTAGSAWAQASPYGTWTRPSTGAQVNFYECGGKLCAKIVGQKDPAKKDTIGKVIMNGASKSGDNEWKGSLLNTDNGSTYNGVVKLESAKALRLEGCVLGGIICTGETWTKN
jgi:uncharacterized protein (DUF2147 family)